MRLRAIPLAALVALPLLAACGATEEAPATVAVVPDTALLSAEQRALGDFAVESATVSPWREGWTIPARLTLDPAATEPLGSIVEGRVMEVRVFPGDRVRRGQVLVAIHSHEVMDARQQLVAARGAATAADSAAVVAVSAAARAERLLAARAVSVAEVERTRAARVAAAAHREAADAEYLRAREFLDHLIGEGEVPPGTDPHWALIRAPFDGVVAGRAVQPGQVVTVGTPLVTVSRTSALALILPLPEQALGAAALGSLVRFTVAAWPDRRFEARVVRVAPQLDSLTRTLDVVALVRDPRGALTPELYASAELLGPAGRSVLTVPSAAVQLFEGDTVVVTGQQRGEGLLLEAVPVRIGRRTRERAEVLAGLTAGTPVVVRGAAVAKAEILRRRSAGEP